MRSTFVRTKAVLEDCVTHIKEQNLSGTPIESYLVEHILIIFGAEVQNEIYKSIEQYASTLADKKLEYFVKVACQRLFRSPKKSEISGLLGLFGELTQKKFNSLIDDSQVTYYSVAVSARHDVAHKYGSKMTIGDFMKALNSADNIIQAVDVALQCRENIEIISEEIPFDRDLRDGAQL